MAYSLKRLRELSDEDLIAGHDEVSQQSVMGMSYYLDELKRREQSRQTEAMLSYTNRIFWLTVFVAILTAINVGVGVLPLFCR